MTPSVPLLRLPQTPVPGCLRNILVLPLVVRDTCDPHPHTCLSSCIASVVWGDASQSPQAERYFLSFALKPISDTCKSSPQSALVQGQLKWLLKSGDPSFGAFSVPIPNFPHYIILSIPWGRASVDNFYFLPILALNKNAILLSG